jgi:hypothetical protein
MHYLFLRQQKKNEAACFFVIRRKIIQKRNLKRKEKVYTRFSKRICQCDTTNNDNKN